MAPKITGYWAGAAPPATVSPAIGQYGQPNYSGGTGWLKGRVADQTGAGVPFAALNVDGCRTAYTTDQQGNYRLELSPGMHIIDSFKSCMASRPGQRSWPPGRPQIWISSPKEW